MLMHHLFAVANLPVSLDSIGNLDFPIDKSWRRVIHPQEIDG